MNGSHKWQIFLECHRNRCTSSWNVENECGITYLMKTNNTLPSGLCMIQKWKNIKSESKYSNYSQSKNRDQRMKSQQIWAPVSRNEQGPTVRFTGLAVFSILGSFFSETGVGQLGCWFWVQVSHSSDWPQIPCTDEVGLELLILLPPPMNECCNDRPPHHFWLGSLYSWAVEVISLISSLSDAQGSPEKYFFFTRWTENCLRRNRLRKMENSRQTKFTASLYLGFCFYSHLWDTSIYVWLPVQIWNL